MRGVVGAPTNLNHEGERRRFVISHLSLAFAIGKRDSVPRFAHLHYNCHYRQITNEKSLVTENGSDHYTTFVLSVIFVVDLSARATTVQRKPSCLIQMRGVVRAPTNLNHEGHEAHEEPVELDAIDSAAFVLSVIFVVEPICARYWETPQ